MSIITKSKRKKLIRELNINEENIKRIYKKKKQKKEDQDYTIYSTSAYAQLSNKVFGNFVENLSKKNKSFYNSIADSVIISGMQFLSRTYVSMMFFTTMIASFVLGFLVLFLTATSKLNPFAIILLTLAAIILGGIITFLVMYAYPASQAARKSKEINDDLPFAIIHMAAIAGSGAKPISMFKLLLKSKEYKGLESEIKKIVNLVNLFGYDLSTALKNVSLRTPSKSLKDLLTGISATIESGGNLKSYLTNVAEDAMTTYRLKRKKYVQVLSTYSDIYTGILIAAPLLFIVVLAIINLMGGTVAGLQVSTIALVGTFVALPIVNIMFYLFLNISQPGE
jgi:archaeal flagellar protein FlaJ